MVLTVHKRRTRFLSTLIFLDQAKIKASDLDVFLVLVFGVPYLLLYDVYRRIALDVRHGTREPVSPTVLREEVVYDAKPDPPSANNDCVIHRRVVWVWVRWKHDDDDGEDVPTCSTYGDRDTLRNRQVNVRLNHNQINESAPVAEG